MLLIQWDESTTQWMTREAVESHLLLKGWLGCIYGLGAAVFPVNKVTWHAVFLARNPQTGGIEARDSWSPPNRFSAGRIIADSPYPWGHISSDGDFCLMANRCIQEDRDGHNPF